MQQKRGKYVLRILCGDLLSRLRAVDVQNQLSVGPIVPFA
jgi:hypothetical protein